MFKSAIAVLVAALTVLPVLAHAQGTQNPNSGSNATNRGTGTGSQSDPMGGAFRGTGTPTFGTSPGMGSDNRRRN